MAEKQVGLILETMKATPQKWRASSKGDAIASDALRPAKVEVHDFELMATFVMTVSAEDLAEMEATAP